MGKKIFLFVGLILALLISGCSSRTQTTDNSPLPENNTNDSNPSANLESKLSDAITSQLNPEKYVLYMEISNLNINSQTVTLSYVTYQATTSSSVYGQMLKIIKVMVNFFNNQEQKPQTIVLDTVDRSDKTYKVTLTWDETIKFANGELSLGDLISKGEGKTEPEPEIAVQNKPSDCREDLIKSAPCFSDAITECRKDVKATINTLYSPRVYKLLGIQSDVCKLQITTELGFSTVEQECEVKQDKISQLSDIEKLLSNCVKTGQT